MLFRSDRKSTRLNSSHTIISYAVFCLKKNTPASPEGEQAVHTAARPRACLARARPCQQARGDRRGRATENPVQPTGEVFFFFKGTGTPQDLPLPPPRPPPF